VASRKEPLLLDRLTFVFGKKAAARTTDRIAAIEEDKRIRTFDVTL
jgi:hypothetical protein